LDRPPRPSLATLLDDFSRHSRETAVVRMLGNRRIATTYGEIARTAARFASFLESHKILPGDRVLLWGQNSAPWLAAFWGCVLRGALVVPLDATGDSAFAQRVIGDIKPSLIVADPALLQSIPASNIPHLLLDQLDALLPLTESPANPSLSRDTPLQIIFTSGTTAAPKGIVHTHGNVLASLDPIERGIQKYRAAEPIFHPLRFLHTLPLSHVFGQFMGIWIPPILAAELHFEDRLVAQQLIQTIRRERISVLTTVPRVLSLIRGYILSTHPSLESEITRASHLSPLRRWWHFRKIHREFGFKFWAFICGGAALPEDQENFWRKLGFALIQGYGLTETTGLIALNHPFHSTAGSVGKPLPGREVRIDSAGQLLVRGSMISTATWQNGAIHQREDPWLATGDLAAVTDGNNIRFLGRQSDAIVTAAGLNIFPDDLESALQSQPLVRAAAVVGVQSAVGPEPFAALIFDGPRAQAELAVVRANENLAPYQRIRRFAIWPDPDFPRTSTGKLQRRKLASWAEALSSAAPASLSPDSDSTPAAAHDWLLDIIAAITHEPPASTSPTARLEEDLHLDSLARVQLAATLEQRLGYVGSPEQFSSVRTLADLRRWANISAAITTPASLSTAAPTTTPPAPAPSPDLPPTPPRILIYALWPWSLPVQLLRAAFIECVMRPLTWILAAPRIRRAPPLAPQPPMLIVANHVTAMDVPLILYALPGRMRRHVAVAMAGEMLDAWRHAYIDESRHARHTPRTLLDFLSLPAYWLVTIFFNVFPLPRAAGYQQSFAHAGRALDRGYNVLIFPEGTRSRSGDLTAFRKGIGLLVQQSHAAVLPVALAGYRDILATPHHRARRWLHAGAIEVRVGAPITFSAPASPEATPDAITAHLHAAVASLLRNDLPPNI
jgi:long-chain acyl-CoA synthetase